MSRQNDRALRFYHEVLELERLHYGIWNEDEDLSLQNLKKAQLRYENFLIENIPEGVENILDVGCGTGILTNQLLKLGYKAEGLSPDINQKEIFTKNVNAPFHHMAFQDFNETDKYDCLIMSESAQYITMDELFNNSLNALRNNGYLMICDYFVNPDAKGKISKSGHKYDDFMKRTEESVYTVKTNIDITDKVLKTLDLAKRTVEKILKAADIGTEKIRYKHPHITKLVLWLSRNKIEKIKKQIQLLDSKAFKANKAYRFMLLQKINN